MISRIRIEAKGRDQQEVVASLNYATNALLNKQTDPEIVGEHEFVEEVVASDIQESGAIHYAGRRVLKFADPAQGSNSGEPMPSTVYYEPRTQSQVDLAANATRGA